MTEGICVVGVMVDNRDAHAKQVQDVLTQHGRHILNRSGIPHPDDPNKGIILVTMLCALEEKEKMENELNAIPEVQTHCMRFE